ncbi:MAG: LamG-like jellyroll fold domain-containing protein [Verrucomicrobiota bacterium]
MNSKSNPAKWLGVHWLAAVMAANVAHSAVLVGLTPATALYDSDVKGIVDDGGTAGSKSGIPVLGTAQLVLGATFNIAFTPTAADLDRAVVGAARTVLLIEVGGTSNGIGLYLIDGVPTLLSKQTSNDKTIPASLNDTSLPAIAVQSPIGKLNAGTAYSFSASWNHAGVIELKVQPDGGIPPVVSSHAISGTPGNWAGNSTLSVGKISVPGSAGGLAGNDAANILGPPYDVNNASNFAGAVGRALFWNASSVTPAVASVPVVLGFETTPLPTTGKVRLHWQVTEGGAPAATSIAIKAGATVLYTAASLQGFQDVNAGGASAFTLTATNASGVTSRSASTAPDNGFSAAVRADSPVAWFRFNESTGSQLIADSAENATPHDGKVFGQPVSGSTGQVDGAALFDGGSGIVTDLILDPGNVTAGFTLEAVVRRSPGAVGAKPVIIAQRGTGGRFILSSAATGAILTDLAGGTTKDADQTLNDDTWAHLVVVVDKLHAEIRWYRDGVQIGSTADGSNPDGTTFDPHLLLESSTSEWIIGIGKAYTDNYWKGFIDEIAVYNSVLDDPNNDNDHADSRIPAHRNAWWGETTGLLDFVSSKTTANAGDPVQLVASIGADITGVTIDHGVGTVPPVNGTSGVTVNPTVTTTYQVSASGPGGPFTRSVTVNVLQYQAPSVKGFIATKTGNAGGVRLHWKVTEGEAPNPVTLTFKAGETVLHTTNTLQGFFDVDAGTAAALVLTATNATGNAEATTVLDKDGAFANAVRADAPVAWFRFNEVAGSEVFADSANNVAPHDGHPFGTPVSGASGIVDGAVTLDGTSGIVSDFILNPAQLDPGFSIEAVVRRAAGSSTSTQDLVGQSDLNGTGRVQLSLDSTGLPRTFLGGSAKTADVRLEEQTWAHLVIVVDAIHTEARWYLDGELIGTTLDGRNPDGTTFDPNFLFEASTGNWNIGVNKSLNTEFWKGQIDEIAIYNTLLDDPNADGDKTDSRIAAHRAAWWSETKGVIQLATAASTIGAGQSTGLNVKVGADITAVSIDHGVGNVPLVNGNGVVTLTPAVTTTYNLTFTGPGGSFPQTVTVTVLQPPAPLAVVSSAIEAGNFIVKFTGTPATTYAVRGSTSLPGPFNEDHGTVATDVNGAGTATIAITPGTPRQFFRIEVLP